MITHHGWFDEAGTVRISASGQHKHFVASMQLHGRRDRWLSKLAPQHTTLTGTSGMYKPVQLLLVHAI